MIISRGWNHKPVGKFDLQVLCWIYRRVRIKRPPPSLQRYLPARGTFAHVVSAQPNALQMHDVKRGYEVSIAFFSQVRMHISYRSMQITAKDSRNAKWLADLPSLFQLKHTKDRILPLDSAHCHLVLSLAHLDSRNSDLSKIPTFSWWWADTTCHLRRTTHLAPTPLFHCILRFPAHGRLIRTLRYSQWLFVHLKLVLFAKLLGVINESAIPQSQYRSLPIIRPWARKLSGSSKRGGGFIFGRLR